MIRRWNDRWFTTCFGRLVRPRSLVLTEDERRFLDESERAEKDRAIFDRIQRAVWSLRFVVVIETALIVVLLIILIAR